MTVRGLRFIHTSDWHLERPLSGLAEVPDHLRDTLLDAAYRSATRIFDLAISENVDFILLAGDILNPTLAGPRAVVFLSDQFERLAKHNITAYWALGPAETMDDALAHHQWPANVQMFSHAQAEQIDHQRDGRVVARVIGRGYASHHELHPADFHPDASDLPTIVVAYAGSDPLVGWPMTSLAFDSPNASGHVSRGLSNDPSITRIAHASHELAQPHDNGLTAFGTHELPSTNNVDPLARIDYWALGGRHRCDVAEDYVAAAHTAKPIGFHTAVSSPAPHTGQHKAPGLIANASQSAGDRFSYRFCGTPQGREHDETGPHGCLMASVSDGRRVRSQFLPMDELRWQDERIDANALRTSDELETILRQRIEALRLESRGASLLTRFTLSGSGKLVQTARRNDVLTKLAERLRTQFGHASPTIWTTGIELEHVAPSAEAAKQDSLLGDFLRMVQRYELGEEPPLDLDQYISDRHRLSGLHDVLAIDDPHQRKRILHEAAHLGAELLTGHLPDEEAKA